VTLFKFNPPDQNNPKETETNTADQAPVSTKPSEIKSPDASAEDHQAESTAPPRVPPATRSAPAKPLRRRVAVPPRRKVAVEGRERSTLGRSTIATERMLTDQPGGGKNALLVTLVAIFLVTLAVGLYVYLGEKPPVATGEITKMWVYSVHNKTRPFMGEGVAGDPFTFDQVLILAQVKLRNQSKTPIYLWDMFTTLKQESGNLDSSAVGANDFARAFVAYPKMRLAQGPPLQRETTLEPGQEIEGRILTHYTITKEEWEKRQGLNFTISFRYQKNLILEPPKEIEVIQ
jgi:hypothetical protein